MRIAMPLAGGQLAVHFGHSEEFLLADVDMERRAVVRTERMPAPPHQPGVLPHWLQTQSVEVVLAGGMGHRAQQMFHALGIRVIAGVPSGSPEKILADFLANTLATGENPCDH